MSPALPLDFAAALKGEKPLELLDRAALLCMLMEDGPVVEGVGRLSTVQALALVAGIGEEAAAAGVEQAVGAGLLIRDEDEFGGIVPAEGPPVSGAVFWCAACGNERAPATDLRCRKCEAQRVRDLEEALAAVTPYAESRAEDKCGGAERGCPECTAAVRVRYPRVPIMPSDGAGPCPPSVPWRLADLAWGTYAGLFGTRQSMERLVERGGWWWSEFTCLLAGHDPGRCSAKLACRAAALRAVEQDALAEERRRIARLIQDAASEAALIPTREALLALRERVLALEDAP